MGETKDIKPMAQDKSNTPDGNNNNRHRGGRGFCNNRNRNQNNAAQIRGKFRGKIKEIAEDIFDNTGPNDAANFNKSLKNIADYLQLTLGNNVLEAVRNMAPMKIVIPPPPQGKTDPSDALKIIPVADIDFYLWKQEHSKASKKKDEYEDHTSKAYIVIINNACLRFAMS
jgi:hypothetical protein